MIFIYSLLSFDGHFNERPLSKAETAKIRARFLGIGSPCDRVSDCVSSLELRHADTENIQRDCERRLQP